MNNEEMLAARRAGRWWIHPFTPELVQPASFDVRLSRHLRLFDTDRYAYITPTREQPDLTYPYVIPDGGSYLVQPGHAVLGSTVEWFWLGPTVAARFEGKSSLGRMTLRTHATAGFIDPGFNGRITVELDVSGALPVELVPGMLIGQVCLFGLVSAVSTDSLYGSAAAGSHYQYQDGPKPGRPVAVYL